MFREKIETSSFSVASRLLPLPLQILGHHFQNGSYPKNIRTLEHSAKINNLQDPTTEH